MRGKWTEIFTRREKDIRLDQERSDGFLHGQGWACTCGCNKRVWGRPHSVGPPKEMCDTGYVPTSGSASEAYRCGYELIDWSKK